MAQVTGTVFVLIDGALLQSKPGASIEMGGFNRTAVMANGVVIGFSEEPVEATISATLAHTFGLKINSIRDFKDGTLVFTTDTGTIYVVSGAFASTTGTLTGGEGDYEVEFKGKATLQVA